MNSKGGKLRFESPSTNGHTRGYNGAKEDAFPEWFLKKHAPQQIGEYVENGKTIKVYESRQA